MKQKVALLLTGLLVGGFLMTVLPVSAHHQPAQRRLAQKVNRLENRLNNVQTRVNNRTQQLDRFGDYIGFIEARQVLSLCPDESNATWEQVPVPEVDLRWLDVCLPENVSSSARHQPSARDLQRILGR